MRRITILLAAVGALLLVPVVQASANGTATVIIEGTGKGKVVSNSPKGKFSKQGVWVGTPPIECSYASPGPATGVCENELEIFEEEPSIEAVDLYATPSPGSLFVGWAVVEGIPLEACEGAPECIAGVETGEGNTVVVAEFECETEGGCEPGPALTVAKEGTGSGTVVSSPAGIECGETCTAEYQENSQVTLTASPSAGSMFISWKGCEKGGVNGRQCTVTMDKAKTVNAKFTTSYDVTVNQVGTGLGKVSSSPGGILCLSNCSTNKVEFKEGTSVTLTAAPSKNQVFTEWTGDCSGSSLTCSLGTLGADKTVGAKFTPLAQHSISLSKSGGGNGTVKTSVAGINCGATCSSMAAAYFQGTVVELTQVPGKGSTFGGWSGACSGTGTCSVTMSAAKSINAEFK